MGAPGNGACRREMHAKKNPNTVQSCNATEWMFARTLFSWRLLRLKLSCVIVRNEAISWQSSIMNQKPNKLKYRWQELTKSNPWKTAQSLATFLATSFRKLAVVTTSADSWYNSKVLRLFFGKTITKPHWFWMQNVSNMFVVVSSLLLLLSGLKIYSTEHWHGMEGCDLITDWQGRHMQANNPKTRLTWQEQQRSKMCLQFVFFRCLSYFVFFEKLHAAVARSTFSSENVQNMSGSDHFLMFRCRKIARRCSEKHMFKSKC